MENYLLEYDDLKTASIQDLIDSIYAIEGKRLDELKVKDLTYHNSKAIWPGEGVYIFRDQKKIIYVGKVTSMSFTERIAKHFDLRHKAWFNRLLELICSKLLELNWNDENAMKASKYAFENLNVVLINFSKRDHIDRTETLLRSCTEALNKFKHKKQVNLEIKLEEYH